MTNDQWIDSVVGRRTATVRSVSKKFLTQLLDGGADDSVLQRVWDDTSPSFWFGKGGLRYFLTELRNKL